MRARKLLPCIAIALAGLAASGCQLLQPKESAPPGPARNESAWVQKPAYGQAIPAGKRMRVTCEDPAKSGLGGELTAAFTRAVAAQGYEPAGADADFQCVLVVRWFGKTAPPDGRNAVLEQAGDTIQGGDEAWLAPDGSGFDTQSRKPRAVRLRSGARGKFSELIKGHEDDQWTLLVDVAIGARHAEQASVVQRHEGRVWVSAQAYELDRAAAKNAISAELAQRFAECLP